MSVFTEVKQYVKPKECLRFYLGPPQKEGPTIFYLSPFRNEKTPSLACHDSKGVTDFGDGSHYDAVSFVSRLFNLSNLEAAQKLASDFHLSTTDYKPESQECKQYKVEKGLRLWREGARKKLRKQIKLLKGLLEIWPPEEALFEELVSLKGDLEMYEDILNTSYDREGWQYVFRQLGGEFIGTKRR